MTLRQTIKKYCRQNKTNILKMALKLGIKPPTLYFILRGNENITVKTAEKLYKVGIFVTYKDNKLTWGLE